MSLKAPKKPGSVRKIIRIPDDVAYEIDQFSMGMYTSRGEFILCAMREFSCALIKISCDKIHTIDQNNIEEDYNKIHNEIIEWIKNLLAEIEITDADEITNVMIYVPHGLITKMRYLYEYYSILKNINIFARAAIEYQLQSLTKESLSLYYNESFYEQFNNKTIDEFLTMEKDLYFFIKKNNCISSLTHTMESYKFDEDTQDQSDLKED